MGTTASMLSMEQVPPWTITVAVKEKYRRDKFASHSEGMSLITPANVVRTRDGKKVTDAARWSRGFTCGRHVFEIVYPSTHRGVGSCVGVGLRTAPLYCKGKVNLIGSNKESWGVDVRSTKAYHNNKVLKRFSGVRRPLPDKFFMYLDVDSGTLQFGSDVGYHGTAISGISTGGEALYPMVASCMPGSSIGMVYRGQGVVVDGYLRKKRR